MAAGSPDPVTPTLRSESLGSVELQYLDYAGEGTPLLFLHATGFLPWLWHPIARRFAPARRVLAPYFCDHRDADPDQGGLHWLTLAEDIATFCERLALDRPCLVGHSMGATVLAMAHAAYGVPARALVLIEPIFLPRELYRLSLRVEDHPLASKSIKRTNHWSDEAAARAYLRTRPLFQKWDEEMLSLYIRYGMKPAAAGGLELTCGPRREAALFMGGNKYDPWPLLARLKCPVLVLEGGQSDIRSYIDLGRVVERIPRVTHRVIAEAGHLLPMEQPTEVVEILRTFIENTGEE